MSPSQFPPAWLSALGAWLPERRPVAAASPGTPVVVDYRLRGDPVQVVLPGNHRSPTWRGGALVFFHGHGMDHTQLTTRTGLALRATAEGWLAASALLGGRRHWSNDAALRAAGRLLVDLPGRFGVDPARIALVGFSMGGGTALTVAANPLGQAYRVAAVACTQGVTDPLALAPPYQRSVREAFGRAAQARVAARSPIVLADRLHGTPLYLEHGEADQAVPSGQTRALAARLAALGIAATVRYHPGAAHAEASIDEAAIIAFLRPFLSPEGAPP
ncbi:MAG: prolyl oligopeptidase family serine peptidase [Candidatus Sericytochromatia bacterium]|nr:prolyl oligopeptidase family serine peptidase [Candidatus Sericytochromatia bacterium]